VRALELMGKHLNLWDKDTSEPTVNLQFNVSEKDALYVIYKVR